MAKFNTSSGDDLEKSFLTKTEFVDRYAGSQLWTWGRNDFGQLGLGDTLTNRTKPEQVVAIKGSNRTAANIALETSWKKVSCRNKKSYAIKTDGTLWYWGSYSTNTPNTFTQIANYGDGSYEMSSGDDHAAVITYSGSIVSIGSNLYGQIGDGTTTDKTTLTLLISGNTSWKKVSCGSNNTSAIKTDGTLWSWGKNDFGQLGDGTSIHKSSPVQSISTSNSWNEISCGGNHTLGIKTDGTLWSWGLNNYGQLGDGTVVSKSSPVQIPGTSWKKVFAGVEISAAIKTDGTLWLWGRNDIGQLGDNTITHRSSPVQTIAGGTNWKLIDCGKNHCLSIKTDGTVWSWGGDSYGELGAAIAGTNRSSPVQLGIGATGGLANSWKQVSCGDNYSAMIGLNV